MLKIACLIVNLHFKIININKKCSYRALKSYKNTRTDWTVEGEINTNLVVTRSATVGLTCASIINRIINVKTGYIPTSRIGEMKYIIK